MNFHSQSPEWQAPLTIHQPPAPTSPPRGPPPTSAPKSNSSPEKKLKLRASCDACAASKVKCSKEHPICARCKTNRSQCIYGVSRKHGKPGRTRKRNPDGTPFVKASKQRPSPDGSEFSKFRVRPEPLNHGDAIFDASAQWSPTPSWSSNTDFEFEMTPEPMFLEPPTTDFAYMDNMIPTTPPELTHMPMLQPELTFVDPFARKQSVMLDLPDVQAIKDFVSHDVSTAPPMDFSFAEQMPMEHNYQAPPPPPLSTSATSSPQSTNSLPPPMYNPLRVSISMPSSHCCYTLAYSTLESLRIINPENSTGVELKSLDSVLSITKSAVANVRQLLNCSCSADPHLAMLYSSITSKILTWYQIAAGVKPAATTFPSAPPSLSDASSPSSSVFGSPLSTPGAEHTTFDIQVKPLKMGVFEFDEEQQAMLRRQVVLRELKKCGTLVDALVDWKGEGGKPAQSEFLYDVLGTWLKTELLKTLTEVESEYCQGL